MNKKNNNQLGFSAVEVLLVILVVAVICFGGYYVWHTHHYKAKPVLTASNSSKTTTSPPNPYAGWQSYTLPVEKLTFMCPANWVVHSNGPSETQDLVQVASADNGFNFDIDDGKPNYSNGGFGIIDYPNWAVPITFVGQSDFLMPNFTPTTGRNSVDNKIYQVELRTSKTAQSNQGGQTYYPADKNAVGFDPVTGKIDAKQITIGGAFGSGLTDQQFLVNPDFKKFELIIESMHY